MHGTVLDLAREIKIEHALAIKHAGSAIDHARRAGELLLRAKAALPHGSFVQWLRDSVPVSERQAQRYMRAALGKTVTPLNIAAPKNDTVSFFPELEPGEALTAVSARKGRWNEFIIVPHTDPDYVHYAHIQGTCDSDGNYLNGFVDFSKRGVARRALKYVLPKDFPWGDAEIERFSHPGFEKNPYADDTTQAIGQIGGA